MCNFPVFSARGIELIEVDAFALTWQPFQVQKPW